MDKTTFELVEASSRTPQDRGIGTLFDIADGRIAVVAPCSYPGYITAHTTSDDPVVAFGAALSRFGGVAVHCLPCLVNCPQRNRTRVAAFDPDFVIAGVDLSDAVGSSSLPVQYTIVMDPGLLPSLDLDTAAVRSSAIQIDRAAEAVELVFVPVQVAVERALGYLSAGTVCRVWGERNNNSLYSSAAAP